MNIFVWKWSKIAAQKKSFFFADFPLVLPPMASVLLSALVERCFVSRMRDFFKQRLDDHSGYITCKDESQPLGAHFNLPGHSLANLKAAIIEQVLKNEEEYRKEREHFFINKFNTYYEGMNKKK